MRIPLLSRRERGETARDPVCGMDVDVNKPRGGVWEHEGTRYYFCASGCNRAFQKDPEEYLSGRKGLDHG